MTAPVPAPFSTAERMALRRYAAGLGINLEEAAAMLIRDQLIAGGWMEWREFDEETETEGEA